MDEAISKWALALDRIVDSVPSSDPTENSEAHFRQLARTAPGELIKRIEHGHLTNPRLSTALEALSESCHAFVVETLKAYVLNETPIVREGAIYGLAGHLDRQDVVETLEQVAKSDDSQAVRKAAEDLL